MIILLLIILLFTCYGWFVLYYWQGWRSIPFYKLPADPPNIEISVIIPARNEEENIGRLLTALNHQTYPKQLFEVLVIDDHSDDTTAEIVSNFPGVRLIQLKEEDLNSYKKKAIEKGIGAARHDWIVTTDADCWPEPAWLEIMVAFLEEKKALFIAAPVTISCSSSLLQVFQAMDFMMLQVITGAAVYKRKLSMCNGANIAYSKKAFNDVNGFEGIDSIASGDDMLLMHKIGRQFPGSIHYLKSKDAVMSTQPMKSWKTFLNQRIRWASKARKYDDKRILPVLLLVYLFNFSFLVLLVAGGWYSCYWFILLGLWVAKTLVELPLFWSAAEFFEKKWALRLFFFFQPLHIFYTIISGLLGQKRKYEWKGRKVK